MGKSHHLLIKYTKKCAESLPTNDFFSTKALKSLLKAIKSIDYSSQQVLPDEVHQTNVGL